MSLFAKYIKERENAELLQHDWGFATYKVGPDYIYVQDFFVDKEERKNGRAQQLMIELIAVATEAGKSSLIGSVDPKDPNSSTMTSIMFSRDFKLISCDGTLIYLKKDL